jgi:DTW domain-containing protein
MLEAACVCALIPAIETRGRWVVVQHRGEHHKTTNTGHLIARSLVGAHRCSFTSRTAPLEPPPGPLGAAWVLFPGEESVAPSTLPVGATIVVPDGTWIQARKMVRTNQEIAGLPRVGLPQEAHARWSLRRDTSDGMSTLDAACWLLAALEGPEVSEPMERLAEAMWAGTLRSRGVRPTANEVPSDPLDPSDG